MWMRSDIQNTKKNRVTRLSGALSISSIIPRILPRTLSTLLRGEFYHFDSCCRYSSSLSFAKNDPWFYASN